MMIFWFRYNIAEKGRKVFAFLSLPGFGDVLFKGNYSMMYRGDSGRMDKRLKLWETTKKINNMRVGKAQC